MYNTISLTRTSIMILATVVSINLGLTVQTFARVDRRTTIWINLGLTIQTFARVDGRTTIWASSEH